MKCPECQAREMKSTLKVVIHPGRVDPALVEQFYDEEGNYHYHDKNEHARTLSCSNGHVVKERLMHGCPQCGEKWREI